MQQIPFPFKLESAYVFANFYDVTANVTAQLQDLLVSPKFLHLVGANNSGKTHLLQALCYFASNKLSSLYIPLSQYIDLSPELLNSADDYDLVCIDDIELIKDSLEWQEKVFHLFNNLADSNKVLVFSSCDLDTKFLLPDLNSRINNLEVLLLKPLNSEDLKQAIKLHGHERGFNLDDKVVNYMVNYLPRDLKYITKLLDKLELESLVAKRKITISMIKDCGFKAKPFKVQ